ncbi:hypothetical protein B0I32_10376 [Nonomuraea fuscirosea]|uniref:Uncharacterized protein n=1 Tax=Nonomuraea fuscirosea TaxID=1291556 RepID=A0A2T0N6G5_9ACTN|nr:hypothetical protein B0I32_10376 [Nonomuraea fuscirosea]
MLSAAPKLSAALKPVGAAEAVGDAGARTRHPP